MAIQLAGSVGKGGQNRPGDVEAVKRRLSELGFAFFAVNDSSDSGLVMAIRLFQSIIAGKNALRGDGRIDVDKATHAFLDASNAPRWQTMPLEGPGFVNFEAMDTTDQHDFGTSWLAQTIEEVAADYQSSYQSTHPGAALFTVNDVSLPEGGNTPDHRGHETGLACDLRLPRKDGSTGGITNPNTNSAYDREAARAQLQALRRHDLVTAIFFNDNDLIGEGLCKRLPHHNNHIHFQIRAPARVP